MTMIPIFKSTEEAIAYGLTATEVDIVEARKRRTEHLKKSKAYQEQGFDLIDKAIIEAVSAQFYREMIEAHDTPERFQTFLKGGKGNE